MSELYDVIIIGASKEGIAAYNRLRKNKQLKLVVLSPNFNNTTSGHTILKADRIYNKVVYSSFNHGLIILDLDNKTTVCGLHVIIAAGLAPAPLNLNTKSICYKVSDINTKSKTSPIALVGNNDFIADAALALSKKYNYIYICNNDKTLHCEARKALDIHNTKNIVVLPLCNIVSCKNNAEGKLYEITLDTYETIRCSYILASNGYRSTITEWFNKSFLKLTDTGLIKVDDNYEVIGFPSLYAIGTCADHSAGNCAEIAAEHILNNIK